MRALFRVHDAIIAGLAVIAAIIVAAIFVAIVQDVLIRTVGLQPPPWTITYVEYALLYFTMCCAPYLVRHKGHVVIESLVSIMPRFLQRLFEILTYLGCIAGSSIFAYESAVLLIDAWVSQRIDVRGVDIHLWILFLPMPPCFALIAIEFIRYLFASDTIYTYDLTDARDSI